MLALAILARSRPVLPNHVNQAQQVILLPLTDIAFLGLHIPRVLLVLAESAMVEAARSADGLTGSGAHLPFWLPIVLHRLEGQDCVMHVLIQVGHAGDYPLLPPPPTPTPEVLQLQSGSCAVALRCMWLTCLQGIHPPI